MPAIDESPESGGRMCRAIPAALLLVVSGAGIAAAQQANECRAGEAGRMTVHDNDVAVDFTVRVPSGVRFSGRTVNGSVTAQSLQGDADGRTVNGRIDISTSGIASAKTVNGSIHVSVGTPVWTDPLEFSTVNGSITVKFPPATDAQVRAEMMNGAFSSDLPLVVQSSR